MTSACQTEKITANLKECRPRQPSTSACTGTKETCHYYYNPIQQGSWSIKSVLPAMAPDLSYESLEGIQDGRMATEAYIEAIQLQTPQARKDELREQLLAYCCLDTFAMVRLWEYFAGRDPA
jgi:hypothetical protein